MACIGTYEEMDKYNYILSFEELEELIYDFLDALGDTSSLIWTRRREKGQELWELEYAADWVWSCKGKDRRDCLDCFYEILVERYFEDRLAEIWEEEKREMNRAYEFAVLGYGKF